jgi:radical SAM protein with 4Fe4S-binding SPASM domain
MTESEKKHPLSNLNLSLSEGCSLSCRQCWSSSSTARNGSGSQFLNIDTAIHCVQEALPLGLSNVRLTGNNVLRYPHFDTLINALEKLELAIHLEINGSGMNLQRADRLGRVPLLHVSIGLDGADAATHDGIHKSPGAFAAAEQAVHLLAEVGLAPQIVFSISRRNAGQTEALVRLAETIGAGSVRFTVQQPEVFNSQASTVSPLQFANQRKNGTGELTIEEQKSHNIAPADLHIQEIIALGRKVERELVFTTRLHLTFDQPPAFRGLHSLSRSEAQQRCGIINAIGLNPSGDYSLCSVGQSLPQLILGKANLDPLEFIWNEHPILLLLRDGMPHRLEGICDRCVMKTVCLGYCPVENYYRTGSFWGPNWFCSSAEQVGLFPAGRLIENQR